MYSVLIIDDDSTSRELMECILRTEGFEVRCAPD